MKFALLRAAWSTQVAQWRGVIDISQGPFSLANDKLLAVVSNADLQPTLIWSQRMWLTITRSHCICLRSSPVTCFLAMPITWTCGHFPSQTCIVGPCKLACVLWKCICLLLQSGAQVCDSRRMEIIQQTSRNVKRGTFSRKAVSIKHYDVIVWCTILKSDKYYPPIVKVSTKISGGFAYRCGDFLLGRFICELLPKRLGDAVEVGAVRG